MRPRVTELTRKKRGGEEVANKRRHYYELSCGCVRGCESVVVSNLGVLLKGFLSMKNGSNRIWQKNL